VNVTTLNLIDNVISSGTLIVSGITSLGSTNVTTISAGTLVGSLVSVGSIGVAGATVGTLYATTITGANLQLSGTISAGTHVGSLFSSGSLGAAGATVGTLYATSITASSAQFSGIVSTGTLQATNVTGKADGASINVTNINDTAESSIKFYSNTTSGAWYMGQNVGVVGPGNFALYRVGTGNVLTAVTTGNIGVRTNAPLYAFDVNGTVNASSGFTGSSITVSGNVRASGATIGNIYTNYITSNNIIITGGNATIFSTSYKPTLNPDAFNSMIVYEDMSQTTLFSSFVTSGNGWSYNQNTGGNSGYIQLGTTTSGSSCMYWNINPGNSFSNTFDFFAGGGTGADEIHFFWYMPSIPSQGAYNNGLSNCYNVWYSEWQNNICLNWNGVTLATYSISNLGNSTWRTTTITCVQNVIRVLLNGVVVINYYDTTNRNINSSNSYMGFSTSTGASNNNHRIRNIKISKLSESLLQFTDISSGNMVLNGGNLGIGTNTPRFTLDVTTGTINAGTYTGGNMQLSGSISASGITAGNINFTGNLYQNGSLYSPGGGGSATWNGFNVTASTSGNAWATTFSGTVFSSNGLDWVTCTQLRPTFNGVVYTNNTWYASSSSNGGSLYRPLLTSTDLVNWSYNTSASTLLTDSRPIVYGNNIWILGGVPSASGNSVIFSTGGNVWANSNSTLSGQCYALAYNGSNMFVAGGNGANVMAYSTNGSTWTALTSNVPTSYCYGIAYGNSTWVAVGSGTNRISYSSNGTSWTGITNPFGNNGTGHGVAYGNGTFVAMSGDGTYKIIYSANGSSWTGVTLPSEFTNYSFSAINGLTFNGTYFIIAGGDPLVIYSSDGITWKYGSNPNIFTTSPSGIASTGQTSSSLMISNQNISFSTGTAQTSYYNTSGTFVAPKSAYYNISMSAYGIGGISGSSLVLGGSGVTNSALNTVSQFIYLSSGNTLQPYISAGKFQSWQVMYT
jgi:hypothetical protein